MKPTFHPVLRNRAGGAVAARIALPVLLALLVPPVAAQPPGGGAASAARMEFEAGTNTVDVRDLPAANLVLVRPGLTERLATGLDRVQLRPSQWLAYRMEGEAEPTASPTRGAAKAWKLPYQILGVDSEGTPLDLRPFVEIDGGGMRPQAGGGFLGRIFMAVRDANRPGESHPLAPAIEMLVTAEVDEVSPRTVSLAKTNDFSEVRLRAARPMDTVRVRIVPTFNLEASEIELSVLRGSLVLSASPRRIQGLGLETADLTIRAEKLPDPANTVVTLSADRGSLEERTLHLDAQGVAATTVRSVTIGTARIRAEAAELSGTTTEVRFLLPWLFLGAALLGGGIGALIRWARTKPAARHPFWIEMVPLGLLVGLLVAAAYATGINLTGFEVTAHAGEAAIFVLAALGALYGVPKKPQDGSVEKP